MIECLHDTSSYKRNKTKTLETNKIQIRRLYLILLIYPNALLDTGCAQGPCEDFPTQAIEELP